MNMNRSNIPWAAGMALSIVFVVGGLFLLIFVIKKIANPLLGLPLFYFVVPIFPSVSVILQGTRKPTVAMLALLYLYEFVSLSFELLTLLLIFPVVALQATSVIVAIVLFVSLVGLGLWVIKFQLGFSVAPGLGPGDHLIYLAIAGGSASALALWYCVNRYGSRRADSFLDLYAEFRERVRAFLWKAIMREEGE